MNEHEVNPDELIRMTEGIIEPEAEQAGPGPGAAVEGEIEPESWRPFVDDIMVHVDTLIMPQWGLTAPEKEALCDSSSRILDQIFPGGPMSPKWLPYIRLIMVTSAIATSRYDRENHCFPPFGRAPIEGEQDGTV